MTDLIAKVGTDIMKTAVKSEKTAVKVGTDAVKTAGIAEKTGKFIGGSARNSYTEALSNVNRLMKCGTRLSGEVPADTFLANVPKREREALTNLLGNPDTVAWTAKANTKGSGFSILGFIGKKGDKTVGKGAISVSDFGYKNAVAKWKVFGKNGQANGFVDCAKAIDAQNASINLANHKGKIGFSANAGEAAQANVFVTPKVGLNYANNLIANGVSMHTPQKVVTNFVDLIKSIIS